MSESDDESIKDFELDSDNDSKVIDWLNGEEDEDVDNTQYVSMKIEPKPIIEIPNSPHFSQNRALYLALMEVEGLNFLSQSINRKEELMKSLEIEKYEPGQIIFEEGTSQMDMYFVVGAQEPRCVGEVEVIKRSDERAHKVLTRLTKGQYFGQMYFLTKRLRNRSATIRVPLDSKCAVIIAKLVPINFHLWDSYRNMLLIKAAPLIQMLPKQDLKEITEKLLVKEYAPNEYIIRQGDAGDEFFIIREGSVKIIDETNKNDPIVLTTLKESHFFGEMSLVTDEPRVASVVAVEETICLTLTKAAFKSASSASTFATILSQVLEQRQNVRRQRALSMVTVDSTVASSFRTTTSHGQSIGMKRLKSIISSPKTNFLHNQSEPTTTKSRRKSFDLKKEHTTEKEVKVTSRVSVKKLSSGSRLINKYLVLRELGRGSFGEVFLCQDEETGIKYAMKVINRNTNSSGNDDITTSIRREIAVMKRLRHENVVSLHEVIDDPSARKIFLIQEFMEGGPLLPDDEKVDPIPEKQCRIYFRDILCGVSYLHAEGIIHRDIKPSNMLLTADKRVKIADFGTAVFANGQEKVAAGGTPVFMSPELCSSDEDLAVISKMPAIDVFALGATLYYMVVGRPPWMASNAIDLATKIRNIELTFPDESLDPHLKHLLKRMLDKDYRTRIPLDEVIVDDWVTMEGSDPLFEEEEADEEIVQVRSNDDLHFQDHGNSLPASTSPRYRAVVKDNRSWSHNVTPVVSQPHTPFSSSMHLMASEPRRQDSSHNQSQQQVLMLQPLSITVKNVLNLYSMIKKSPRKRAMIINEKAVLRRQISNQLKELRVRSTFADSKDLALKLLSSGSETFHYIFYDYDTSSIEHIHDDIKYLRSTGYSGSIVMTIDGADQATRMLSEGADFVIIKPVQPEYLKQIIYRESFSDISLDVVDQNIFGLQIDDPILLNYDSMTKSVANSPTNALTRKLSKLWQFDDSTKFSSSLAQMLPKTTTASSANAHMEDSYSKYLLSRYPSRPLEGTEVDAISMNFSKMQRMNSHTNLVCGVNVLESTEEEDASLFSPMSVKEPTSEKRRSMDVLGGRPPLTPSIHDESSPIISTLSASSPFQKVQELKRSQSTRLLPSIDLVPASSVTSKGPLTQKYKQSAMTSNFQSLPLL